VALTRNHMSGEDRILLFAVSKFVVSCFLLSAEQSCCLIYPASVTPAREGLKAQTAKGSSGPVIDKRSPLFVLTILSN
jgi:hypothetical protein